VGLKLTSNVRWVADDHIRFRQLNRVKVRADDIGQLNTERFCGGCLRASEGLRIRFGSMNQGGRGCCRSTQLSQLLDCSEGKRPFSNTQV